MSRQYAAGSVENNEVFCWIVGNVLIDFCNPYTLCNPCTLSKKVTLKLFHAVHNSIHVLSLKLQSPLRLSGPMAFRKIAYIITRFKYRTDFALAFFSCKGNSFQWDVASRVKKSSSSCCRFAHLSLSTVNIPVSNLSSTALDYGKGNIALHHRKRRRVDSVVTMEAFRPRKQTDFFIRQSFQRKYLGEGVGKFSQKKAFNVSIAIIF